MNCLCEMIQNLGIQVYRELIFFIRYLVKSQLLHDDSTHSMCNMLTQLYALSQLAKGKDYPSLNSKAILVSTL